MKKFVSLLFLLITVTSVLALSVRTRYFVGKTEVSESFWNLMPDTLEYVTSEFDYDTLIIKARELPFTHYIDSVSVPGKYMLSHRPPEVITELEQAFTTINNDKRKQSLFVSEGESTSNIKLIKYSDGKITDEFFIPGHCYLLSFWAIWCGNCLYELRPEFIPSVAKKFCGNPNFHFVPICIDASMDDLRTFFLKHAGSKWSYLADITYLDTDRKANATFGEGGVMPLNVVIGKDGSIRYIHSGVIKTTKQLCTISNAIESGL